MCHHEINFCRFYSWWYHRVKKKKCGFESKIFSRIINRLIFSSKNYYFFIYSSFTSVASIVGLINLNIFVWSTWQGSEKKNQHVIKYCQVSLKFAKICKYIHFVLQFSKNVIFNLIADNIFTTKICTCLSLSVKDVFQN